MTHEDATAERSSAWKGWVLGLVAAPVVYVLSVPPVALSVVYDKKAGIFTTRPTWLEWYIAPGNWLYSSVPLAKKPMDVYGAWWIKMYTGKSAP